VQNRRRLAEGTLVAIEEHQQEVAKVQKHAPCAPPSHGSVRPMDGVDLKMRPAMSCQGFPIDSPKGPEARS